jgi:hypothetical protein
MSLALGEESMHQLDDALQRTQEVQKILLLVLCQPVEKPPHNSIGLGPGTPVFLDYSFQIASPAVMKEKDALSEPPERRSPELSRRCLTLTDAVSESIR